MGSRRCLMICLLVAGSIFFYGCDGCGPTQRPPQRQPADSKAQRPPQRKPADSRVQPQPQRKPADWKEQIERLKSEIAQLQQDIRTYEDQSKQLQEAVSHQSEENARLQTMVEQDKWRIRFLVLFVVLLLGLPLAVFGGALFGKRRPAKIEAVITECPKCHWKLEPGMGRCPNPSCQTRLK